MRFHLEYSAIKALASRMKDAAVTDFRDPLQQAGAYMIKSVDRNFKAGGRPSAWPRSSGADQRSGRSASGRVQQGKTLMATGTLRNSIMGGAGQVYELTPNTLVLGTNVVYAAVHNFGGDIEQTVRSYTRRQQMVFGRLLDSPIDVQVRSFSRVLRMPERRFMLIQPEDREFIIRLFARWLRKRLMGVV